MESKKQELGKDYWDNRYQNREIAWDIGAVSGPLKAYIDQLHDKNISILIPGCGNAYEASYLLEQGFTNVTLVDISPLAVQAVKEKLSGYLDKQLHVICGDFFDLDQTFDLILEQTFFCALDPSYRTKYADKMYSLLKPAGKIVGVLFNRNFEESPPFGGNRDEYQQLFQEKFSLEIMEPCYNSIDKRAGNEFFIKFLKA